MARAGGRCLPACLRARPPGRAGACMQRAAAWLVAGRLALPPRSAQVPKALRALRRAGQPAAAIAASRYDRPDRHARHARRARLWLARLAARALPARPGAFDSQPGRGLALRARRRDVGSP